MQICHEDNRAVHVADYEGSAGRRPFTRDELQALFDVADDAVSEAARSSAVLARTLNLTPHTAVRWVSVAGGDWNRYAAELLHTRDREPENSVHEGY